MKNNFKIFFYLSITLFLFSCHEDDQHYIKYVQNDYNELIIKKVDNPQNSNALLLNTINNLSKYQSRGHSNNLNITIDTDISYFIENNHYHSYTFPIQNADDSSLVRNLLFSLQSDGSYKTILITYDLTELEKTKIRNNEFVDLSHPNKVNWQEIDVLTNETFNDDIEFNDGLFYDSDGGYCYEILRLVHPKDFSLTTNLKITVDCPWDGEMDHMDESIKDDGRGSGGNSDNGDEGEDPNTSGGQSNSDENGNNSNHNNDNSDETSNNGNEHNQNDDCLKPEPNGDCQGDVTTIILPVDDEDEDEHCKALKKLTKTDSLSANILPVVNTLRTKTSENKEYSANFEKNINYEIGEYEYLNDNGIVQGASLTESPIEIGTRPFGQIHTHPDKTQPMFSWSDVARIEEVYNALHSDFNKKDVFIMIVNHDGSVYTIKIDDIQILSQAVQDDFENTKGRDDDKKEKNLNKKMKHLYHENQDNLEGAFLNRFKDFGISLYKATDQNLSNWEKLELQDPNDKDSTVNSQTCN